MPSTAIREISYDEETATLFVRFLDGDLYAYFDVAAPAYRAFRRARSKGRFFAYEVRDRYRYARVDEGPRAPRAKVDTGLASPPFGSPPGVL